MSALGQKQTSRYTSNQCPLYPQKRTSELTRGMSALCQNRKSRRVHSITLSACANNVPGTFRPNALAVLRLTANSNLIGV